MRTQLALLVVLASACLPNAIAGAYVARTASERTPYYGWFRADLPAPDGGYAERFERVGARLDEVGCEALGQRQGDAGRPIWVLVHGVGGEGPEMRGALPLLMEAQPASIFMFRWAPWEQRDVLVSQLAGGLSRLARCIPHAAGRTVVIAHSAGGVLASLAMSHVVAPRQAPEPWLVLLTVASPLSGAVSGPLRDGDPDLMFFMDLGIQPTYPKATAGVRVLHLRTRPPADVEMTALLGHVPNDARVGVPGALQLELPATLSHADALVYVAGRLSSGAFDPWCEAPAP